MIDSAHTPIERAATTRGAAEQRDFERREVAAHYEHDPEIFSLILDQRLAYSTVSGQRVPPFFPGRALLRYVLTPVVKYVVKDSEFGSHGDIDGRRASSSLVIGGEASDFAGSFSAWIIGWHCGSSA